MRTHIDWLTFTGTPIYSTDNAEDYTVAIRTGLIAELGLNLFETIMPGLPDVRERSRAPYADAWEWKEREITLFASPSLTHFTVEISGRGCEILIENEMMNKLLTSVQSRVTRIDVACDIETNTTPTNFVSLVKHDRMRASGFMKSESGETFYVGSQKSERYARVYRYNHPHPRAHLLRIEHVFRRDYAKVVATSICESGIESVAAASGEAFGWQHTDWKPNDNSLADISIVSPERNGGKTIFWLVNSVAPSFKRLCENGTIRNPEEFLRQHFIPD